MKMMKNHFTLYFLLICLFMACKNTEDTSVVPGDLSTIDCDNLTTALLDLNESTLESILNPELENFKLLDQDNDVCLHDNNLQAFEDLLNDNCEKITASVLCCGCIKTLPLLSEVSLQIDSLGVDVIRILDLVTPDEGGASLSYGGVH